MTDNSKLNLLKLITNQPTETPGANVPTYYDLDRQYNALGWAVENIGYDKFRATPYDTIEYKGKQISFNERFIIVSEKNSSKTVVFSVPSSYALLDLCCDEEGVYGLINNGGAIQILYYTNIGDKNPNGYYSTNYKKYYTITNVLQVVCGDTNLQTSGYCGAIRMLKSPIDGRFLIFTCTANQTYYSVIEYTINIGGENSFRYQRFSTSNLSTDFPTISGVYASWSQDDVQYAWGINGKTSVVQSKSNFNLYEIFGSMSAISYNTLKSLTNCVCAPITIRRSATPQIKYLTFYKKYISYVQIGGSSVGEWNGATIYLVENNNGTERVLSQTSTDYGEKNGSTFKNESDIHIVDTEMLAIESKLTAEDKLTATLKQLIGSSMSEHIIKSELDYDVTSALTFSLIFKDYNLYNYVFQMDDYAYLSRAVYRVGGYNGTSFFGKNSLKAVSGVIYAVAGYPIFARDLYNKSKIGNSISSVVHIPQNFTDPTADILYTKDLVSETDSVIDEKVNELIKDEYEELYLNYIDSYKVIDNNDKSTYMSSATSHIVDEILDGFQDYKVSNYRINYKNGTHKDRALNPITIEDGIGTIEILVGVPSYGIDTLEFYDKDYTTPFCSIDLSNYAEGTYRLVDHIKVE